MHQRRESHQYIELKKPSRDEESNPGTPVKLSEPTWRNMPNKLQLFVLALSRLVDFWQMASLQSYMVWQLRSFDSALPEAVISHQAGILQGSFTAAQIVTSILWGRAADSPVMGRKNVLLIGLVGTAISCIGVGFSRTFWQAAVWRLLGGAINGTVGAARTMVAETVDKKWHSRAFLLLPIAFNVANILGPVVGGMLVNPVATYPAAFEGRSGLGWMAMYPYAPPSLLCAALLLAEAGLVSKFLTETLPLKHDALSLSGQLEDMVNGVVSILSGRSSYIPVENQEQSPSMISRVERETRPVSRLPFHRIWTPNVLWTLLSVAIFDFHMGAFSGLWIIFLSASRSVTNSASPIYFTGGLGFQPALLGTSLAILGIVGLGLQVLLYPWANGRFGLMSCFRYSLILFPAAYMLAPYLSLLPSVSDIPLPASGTCIWAGISLVLTIQVTARTFALPASIILVNNASPHPSVLGTIHGVGQSVSSTFRTIGPIAAGYWYGLSLDMGMVGFSWWIVATVSAFGCFASLWVRNGTGHEIVLPGEDDSVSEK
ncbi:MFS general substrate transporter [Corynespora cassiicola Philippines]|uniref:MFS general substrate transporter n=1 Tax=Corynespora cassiicola Philippines TaxID=1448308 RepID=A0A2T2NC29_CORCC|nr:MFS general substrate transporter [Corynespora cassiicola Philippines]